MLNYQKQSRSLISLIKHRLPDRCRRFKYRYVRFVEEDYSVTDIANENIPYCDICLGTLSNHGMLNDESDNRGYNKLIKRIGLYSKTPCLHIFHYTCLYSYLKVHDSCPICLEKLEELIASDN